MDKYLIWNFFDVGRGYAFAESIKGLEYKDVFKIMSGMKLSKPLPDVIVDTLSDGEIGELIGTYWSGFIVSEELSKLLSEENIQFVPIKVTGVIKKKFIANFLEIIDCIDFDNSKLEWFEDTPNSIKRVEKLVLKPISTAAKCFRIKELNQTIVVTQELANTLIKTFDSVGFFTSINKFSF